MKWLDRILTLARRSDPARPIRVTIEPHSIAVHKLDGSCTRTPVAAATFERDLEQALQAAGVDSSRDQVAVTVDASAAHFDLLRWSAELSSAKRWEQFSSARLTHARADDASRWSIRVLRDAPPRAALSAALPATTLTALRKTLARLSGVRIGFLDRINALLARDRAFSGCVVDVGQERVWIFVLRAGVIERVRLRRMQSAVNADAESDGATELLPILASEWAATGGSELPAIALAGSHAAAAAVALHDRFDGNVIALTHRQSRGRFDVDFAHARPPVPAHGWALAAAGVFSIAAAIAWTLPDWQQRTELGAARSRIETALASTQPVQPAAQAAQKVRGAQASTSRSRDTQTEAQLLTLELSKPWGALFGALESSSNNRVRIVQVDVDNRFRQLQIHAEAKSLGELIRYADRLASSAPVSSARLAHHEWKASGGVRIVSARVVAQLNPKSEREATATARSDAVPRKAVALLGPMNR